MAFVSMMFVFFLIAAVILGALLITGLVLLIVGIVRKCSQKNAGKKSPAVLIATGAVLLAIPVVLAVGLGIWGVSAAVSTAFKRTQYECVPDRWRNEWVTDSRAEEDILDALFTSADNGDREAFGKNFTPELQSREDFTEAVNAFFSAYPKGLAGCEQKDVRLRERGLADASLHGSEAGAPRGRITREHRPIPVADHPGENRRRDEIHLRAILQRTPWQVDPQLGTWRIGEHAFR